MLDDKATNCAPEWSTDSWFAPARALASVVERTVTWPSRSSTPGWRLAVDRGWSSDCCDPRLPNAICDRIHQPARHGRCERSNGGLASGVGKGIRQPIHERLRVLNDDIHWQAEFLADARPHAWRAGRHQVRPAELHRETQLLQWHIRVGKGGGNVIKRCQSHLSSRQHDGVVLRMSISAANEPVHHQSIQESGYRTIGLLTGQCSPQQAHDRRRGRTTVIPVLPSGRHPQCLAGVFLMNTPYPSFRRVDSVVSLGDNGALIVKGPNPRVRRDEARATCSGQAEVRVEVVIIEAHHGWLQNVAGRRRSAWHTPTTVLVEQCSLGLGAGKAESTTEISAEPRGRVLFHIAQSLRNVRVGQALNSVLSRPRAVCRGGAPLIWRSYRAAADLYRWPQSTEATWTRTF